MSSAAPAPHVIDFYDEHIVHKVADFVDGNRRVEAAWQTIQRWAPESPACVIEIGCGLGAMAYRMAERWPDARVIGVDISPRSIEFGQRLFQLPNLSYSNARPETLGLDGMCDLVVLVDVFEHIAVSERASFITSIAGLMAPTSRLVLTFPTPAYQQSLRDEAPEKLQPVDEDVDWCALQEIAAITRSDLVLFQEQNIWLTGDYAHAVLARRKTGVPVERPQAEEPDTLSRAVQKVRTLLHGEDPQSRNARLRLVERTLGAAAYRPR